MTPSSGSDWQGGVVAVKVTVARLLALIQGAEQEALLLVQEDTPWLFIVHLLSLFRQSLRQLRYGPRQLSEVFFFSRICSSGVPIRSAGGLQ